MIDETLCGPSLQYSALIDICAGKRSKSAQRAEVAVLKADAKMAATAEEEDEEMKKSKTVDAHPVAVAAEEPNKKKATTFNENAA
jgi:hypothetical protein